LADLIEALSDKDALVRMRAARALGRMGPDAKEAIPALLEAVNHPEPPVRQAAAEALREIGPAEDGVQDSAGAGP
jgi:HEAT repeat protein